MYNCQVLGEQNAVADNIISLCYGDVTADHTIHTWIFVNLKEIMTVRQTLETVKQELEWTLIFIHVLVPEDGQILTA